MSSFYKVNNEVLKFDIDKDIEEIRFNHWIIKKENYERLNNELEKGLFKMTVRQVEKDLGVTFHKARGLIKKFEKLGIIKVYKQAKSRAEASIYSYEVVFNCDEKNRTVQHTVDNTVNLSNSNDCKDEDSTVKRTVNRTPKKENKKENKKDIYSCTSNEVQLASYLYKLIQKNNPKAKKPNIQSWARHVDLMIRRDNRSVEDIKTVIDYCQNDKFWYSNILSTKKLRDQFDMLYLKAIEKQKTPTAIGANKNNYNSSICNSTYKNTENIKVHKFV